MHLILLTQLIFVSGGVCVLGLILHEEHIELLTEDYKELKREVEGKILKEGTLHFTGKRRECASLWLLTVSLNQNSLSFSIAKYVFWFSFRIWFRF